jgi:hypothetical protein
MILAGGFLHGSIERQTSLFSGPSLPGSSALIDSPPSSLALPHAPILQAPCVLGQFSPTTTIYPGYGLGYKPQLSLLP